MDSATDTFLFVMPAHNLTCLFFANDITLISMRKAGLQKQLNILKKFCDDKGLQVNSQKTFTMSFGMNALRTDWIPFQYDGTPLQPRKEAKYLGMMFFTNKSFPTARKALMAKARAKMWALHRLMISRQRIDYGPALDCFWPGSFDPLPLAPPVLTDGRNIRHSWLNGWICAPSQGRLSAKEGFELLIGFGHHLLKPDNFFSGLTPKEQIQVMVRQMFNLGLIVQMCYCRGHGACLPGDRTHRVTGP